MTSVHDTRPGLSPSFWHGLANGLTFVLFIIGGATLPLWFDWFAAAVVAAWEAVR